MFLIDFLDLEISWWILDFILDGFLGIYLALGATAALQVFLFL